MAATDGTVGKALDVLEKVAERDRPVRFSDLLAESELPKATLYRLLQTLTNQGMLRHDAETGAYSLGVRLVRLAHRAWSTASLAPLARPHLDALARQTGQTIHLAQLDTAQVLYVDKRSAETPVEMFSQAGKIGPAYCTGVGKTMLAFLPVAQQDRLIQQQSFHAFTDQTLDTPERLRAELVAIAARGHGYDREEHEPGIICVAVPILSAGGRVLGGLSVTGHKDHVALATLEGHLPALKTTARAIAEDAADWAFPERGSEAVMTRREEDTCRESG